MRRVVVVGLVASLLAIAGDAAGVRSPFPRGGLLAFTCSSCPGAEVDPMIFTMRTDGRALRALAEGVGGYEPEWSPDGETIAFTRGFEAIWVMSADGREARPLFTSTVDAGGATQPTWSADGRRVAFVRNGELWTISARGGSARLLLAAPTPVVDPEWSPDGTRIAFGDVQERLWVAKANGTGRRRLGPPVLRGREPRWSPDGRRIAFLTLGDRHAFRVLELRTGRVRTVFEGATFAAHAWSPDGRWLAAVRTTPIPCDESAGECSERLEIWIVSATGAPRGRVYVNESGGEVYGVDWRPARFAG